MIFDPINVRQEANDGQIRAIEERSISFPLMHLVWESFVGVGFEIHVLGICIYIWKYFVSDTFMFLKPTQVDLLENGSSD